MDDKKNIIPNEGMELNEEELEQAAGGGTGFPRYTKCAYCGMNMMAAFAHIGSDGQFYCNRNCEIQKQNASNLS